LPHNGNVAVDTRWINPKSRSGIHTYTLRLIEALTSFIPSKDLYLAAVSENEIYLRSKFPNVKTLKACRAQQNWFLKKAGIFQSLGPDINLNGLIKNENIGCLIVPQINERSYIPEIEGCNVLGILHDTQQLSLEKRIYKRRLDKILLGRNLKRVTKVVAISQATKKELLNSFLSIENKVEVIPNYIPFSDLSHVNEIVSGPYILSVSAMEPYKNIYGLISAFSLVAEIVPHKLIIKSNRNTYWENVLLPLVKNLQLENRIILISEILSEDEMASLYSGADLYVTLSKMEGFGYTAVEAALREVPVLASDIAAVREATKGTSVYLDPCDTNAAAGKIILMIEEKATRSDKLSRISDLLKREYSVENYSERLMRVILT
jgi:glycosyltransferase involved in cell wall biosynthesis